MKIYRVLFLMALICGLSGLAKADTIDFHMTVLDPPNALNYTPINGKKAFDVNFGVCPTNLKAEGYTGCFTGYNETKNTTFYSLDIVFANNGALNGQNATCDTATTLPSVFANSSCTTPTTGDPFYDLQFYGGFGITPGEFFFIAETGVAPKDFGTGTATVATPEPNSILLLSSGIVLMGVFFISRRRVEGWARS